MGFWGALAVFAVLGSAPAGAPASEAPRAEPKPLPTARERATDHDGPEAAAKRTAQRDAGLRPVPFTAKTVRATNRRVISPDLRDPFLVAQRSDDGNRGRKRLQLHDDLRDPFATHRSGPPDPTPPADLRDPFDAPHDTPACRATTDEGVKIQRPKSLRKSGCPAASTQHLTGLVARR
jgi:hypothetical protein